MTSPIIRVFFRNLIQTVASLIPPFPRFNSKRPFTTHPSEPPRVIGPRSSRPSAPKNERVLLLPSRDLSAVLPPPASLPLAAVALCLSLTYLGNRFAARLPTLFP